MIEWIKLKEKFGLKTASKKFEELALMYVEDVYPQYEWEATPLKGDGNRDVQLVPKDEIDYDIWAEAKFRNSGKKQDENLRSLERKDLDSTVLSGLICGHVRMIIFISNAKLPSSVMNRAMLGAKIRGIDVTAVLSPQLENWLIKNPEKYKIIFEEDLCPDIAERILYDIESANIYDPISTDFNPLNKKKDFLINEFAILNIIINSSSSIDGCIKQEEQLPFIFIKKDGYENPSKFTVSPGVSNLVFLVKMKKTHTGFININVNIDNLDFYVSTNNINIYKNNNIALSYSKQLEIIDKVENVIKNTNAFENGMIITLYAESSMGKSFVLRHIYNDLSMNYDMTLICFDSNKDNLTNYMLLCKSILFINFGNIFWDYDFSDKSATEIFKQKIKNSYSNNVFDIEILLQIIDGCYDANIAKNVIKLIISKDKISLFESNRKKRSKILLIDDFQYLDSTQAQFIKMLLEQLKKDNNSVIVVISSTKGKYLSAELEKYFLSLTSNSFILDGLDKMDKEQTIQNIYELSQEKCESLCIVLPSSPLLACEIIKIISEKISKTVTEPIDIILAYSKCVDEIQILRNKFSDFEKQYYLLDIIYRFKKGIPSKILNDYFQFNPQYTFDVQSLISNNFIKGDGEYIVPYHDFYINSYKNLRKEQFNNFNVGAFLKYLLDLSQPDNKLDKNHILSMILRCGDQYKKDYETGVQDLILKYVHETKFGVAIHFCEYYYEQIKLMNRNNLSHDQAYYLYLYADCLVHCGKQGEALILLEDIYRDAPSDSLPKYEAGASVLTQKFWRMCPVEIIPNSFYIQNGIEKMDTTEFSDMDLARVEKAYDSCFNRRMMAYFLIDDLTNARKTYLLRLRTLSNTKKNLTDFYSKSATLIMDYARCIVRYDISEGYRLMKLSLKFFETDSQKHYRRILICRVDNAVFENIFNNTFNTKEFNESLKSLLDGQFYSEYFKSVMKKSICSIIHYSNLHKNGSCFSPHCQIINDIQTAISKALMDTNLLPKDRDNLLLYYLYSFIDICNGDINHAKEYLEKCLDITNAVGESYKFCINHNLNNISTIKHIKWYSENEEYSSTDFLVDCRFW